MRYHEFLLEYNREITIRQFGKGIVDALANTKNQRDKRMYFDYQDHFRKIGYDQNRIANTIVQNLTSTFENNDPTPNNQYTPWIAREYVKGNIRALEDLSRIKVALETYHKYKNTRQFKELFKYNVGFNDISKLSADQIEGIAEKIQTSIVPKEIEKKSKGTAVVVYDGTDAKVIVPEDVDAACYYGQGTRWCTAATKGENQFEYYSGRSNLYIILPKKPQYPGEKYQLHLADQQFMNAEDEEAPLTLLKKRFRGFYRWLKKESDEIDLTDFL